MIISSLCHEMDVTNTLHCCGIDVSTTVLGPERFLSDILLIGCSDVSDTYVGHRSDVTYTLLVCEENFSNTLFGCWRYVSDTLLSFQFM